MRILFRDFEKTDYLIINDSYDILAVFEEYQDAINYIFSLDTKLKAC